MILSKDNDFAFYRNPESVKPVVQSTIDDQNDVVEDLMSAHSEGEALVYVEHINWINFTEFGQPKPIYINLIRHPIEKVVSGYYYQRHPAIFGYYLSQQPNLAVPDKEWFDTSFNDCVKQAKIKDCNFDSHNKYNGDWRRLAVHFCGNAKLCK